MIKKMLSVIGLAIVLTGVAAGTANAGDPPDTTHCSPSSASACWGWPK
ncbi:hypothetical protein ACFTSF_03575 [Kribbella sp. NPDC056951]